jgi:small subunit ribosomal protein S12
MTIFYFIICVFLATITQNTNIRTKRIKKKPFSRTPALLKSSFAKGIITKITTMTPKKPNSAIRHVAKIKLQNHKRVTARLPGIGYLCTRYNRVLIRGGRANDLPGVGYTVVRGVYDFAALFAKKRKRSKYGASRLEGSITHIRRCFRKLHNL